MNWRITRATIVMCFVVPGLMFLLPLLGQTPNWSNPNHQMWLGHNSGIMVSATALRTEEVPWKMRVRLERISPAEGQEPELRSMTLILQCDKRWASGDLNRDGKVDFLDGQVFSLCAEKREPDATCTPDVFVCCDHDNDLHVDAEDWDWLRSRVGG